MKKGEFDKKGLIGPNCHADDSNEIENSDEDDQLATQFFNFFSMNDCPSIMF